MQIVREDGWTAEEHTDVSAEMLTYSYVIQHQRLDDIVQVLVHGWIHTIKQQSLYLYGSTLPSSICFLSYSPGPATFVANVLATYACLCYIEIVGCCSLGMG